MNAYFRTFSALAMGAVLASCSTAAEPRHSDVDLARSVWLSSHVTSYRFEIATASSWFPKSEYYLVQVEDGKIVSVRNAARQPVTKSLLTIDEIWDRLLAARERGELNSAQFNAEGVPVETDYGPWPVDGGVHYSVRNFTRLR